MPTLKPTHATKRHLIGIVAIFIFSFAAAFVALQPSTARAWRMATTKLPEPYTELYFTDYGTLPPKISVDEPYVIHYRFTNHENHPVTYQYRIVLTQGDSAKQLEAGQI